MNSCGEKEEVDIVVFEITAGGELILTKSASGVIEATVYSWDRNVVTVTISVRKIAETTSNLYTGTRNTATTFGTALNVQFIVTY